MKRRSLFLPTVCSVAATACLACAATTIINENFDGYADTAAVGAAWTLSGGTLDTTNGSPGQSLNHPGTATTNTRTFTAIVPTAAAPVFFSASLYDDGLSANKRISAGLRAAAALNLVEMGFYNSPSHYSVRTVLFDPPSSGGNWVAFTNLVDDAGAAITNVPVAGWHTFSALITDTQITFTLDLNSDGNINAQFVQAATANPAGFDIVRLGGPSGLSSAGGGANFDNIQLTVIPEPSSFAMLALGVLPLLTRRRR
jgi:hypothetical protein